MSYEPRPDASGDTLRASRDQIRTNFTILRDRFQDNHADFSSGTGKHKFMQMPQQSSAPTTAVDEGALYTKNVSGSSELFFRKESNGAEIQLTGQFSSATNGHAVIGGIKIEWGTNSATGSTTTVQAFSSAFSAPAFSVVATMHRNASNVDVIYIVPSSITASQFEVRNTSSSNRDYSWIAIGPL